MAKNVETKSEFEKMFPKPKSPNLINRWHGCREGWLEFGKWAKEIIIKNPNNFINKIFDEVGVLIGENDNKDS